jgi:hypothetical protein
MGLHGAEYTSLLSRLVLPSIQVITLGGLLSRKQVRRFIICPWCRCIVGWGFFDSWTGQPRSSCLLKSSAFGQTILLLFVDGNSPGF